MASITEVSKIAGVSPATVSNVVNNKSSVAAETAVRVRQAMRQAGYAPTGKTYRKTVKSAKSKNIGIWFGSKNYSDINFPLYARIIRSLQKELSAGRHNAIIMNTDHGVPENSSTLKLLDGAVMIGKSFSQQAYSLAESFGFKIVFVLGYLEDSLGFSCDHIIPSNPYIGKLAARYLIDRGHSTIGVINPRRLKHIATDIREDCFVNYSVSNGAKVVRFHIDFKDDSDGQIVSVEQEPALSELIDGYLSLDNKPTGLFVPTDANLVSVQKAFNRAGIYAGRDVDFIGCNNDQALLSGLDVIPATIDIGIEQICSLAVERVLYRLDHSDCNDEGVLISVKPELIEGQVGLDFDNLQEYNLFEPAAVEAKPVVS